MHEEDSLSRTAPTAARRAAHGALGAVLALVMAFAGLAATAAPSRAATGPLHSYIVNARAISLTAQAANAATKAGGRVVQQWPQIGVVIVQSTRTNFLTALLAQHSYAVLSAADSRNMAVRESPAPAGSVTVPVVTSRTGTSKRLTGRADSLTGRQWYLKSTGALAAASRTEGNSRVVIGILDTGVDGTHTDISRNFDAADSVNCTNGGRPDTRPGRWTGASHGTHVAGIAAAAQQGWGIQGVAPNARIASVKVVTADDATWPEFLVCGFMWSALRHITVTNNSYNVYDLWCGQQGLAAPAMLAVQRAITYATAKGVTHVQAAGNDGLNLRSQVGKRCFDPLMNRRDVVQVSAVDGSGHLLEFSNTGLGQIDIAAPGMNIYSSVPHNLYDRLTGTSQAAPQVAGALALLASEHPTAKPAQLVTGLLARSTRASCRWGDYGCTRSGRYTSYYGAGILNVKAAIVPTRGTAPVPLLTSAPR